jgi:hypothetical protein
MTSTPDQSHAVGGVWDSFTARTERVRRPFRAWRRGRPFSAGLCVILAGLEIYWSPHSGIGKMLSMGIPGISAIFIGAFLVIFGLTIWLFPAYRVFAGIAAIMLALLSLIAINIGGFFIGFLLGMLGGAFAVAWAPRPGYTAETRRQRRKRLASETQFTAGESAEAVAAVPQGAEAEAAAEPEAAQAASTTTAEETAETAPIVPIVPAGLSAEESAEYTENTQIIEQAARPDEAGPAAGTTTEQE